jgi:acetyl esterase/lipase
MSALAAVLSAPPFAAVRQDTPPTTPPATQPGSDTSRSRRPNAAQPKRPNANAGVPDGIQVVRDVVFAQAPTDAGKTIDLKMDTAFLKESDGKPMPAVIYIHGGGWAGGSKEAGTRQTIALALGGYFSVTINYRLSDEAIYPAAVHDCKAAIRFLRANAERLGIDPDRIGVWGHSAGGHLSALMATSGDAEAVEGKVGTTGVSSRVQCAVDLSGPVELNFDGPGGVVAKWIGGPLNEHADAVKQASPLTYIDPNDPPVLIVHGLQDDVVNVRHAVKFEKALKDAGVHAEYMPVEGAGHDIERPVVLMRAAAFFDAQLKGHAVEAISAYATVATTGRADNPPAATKPQPAPPPKP